MLEILENFRNFGKFLEILENFRNFGKYKNFVKILEFLEILDCLESLETLENQETSEKEKRLLNLTDLYKKRGACSYPRLKILTYGKDDLRGLSTLNIH